MNQVLFYYLKKSALFEYLQKVWLLGSILLSPLCQAPSLLTRKQACMILTCVGNFQSTSKALSEQEGKLKEIRDSKKSAMADLKAQQRVRTPTIAYALVPTM
jgi:hypothetical protein